MLFPAAAALLLAAVQADPAPLDDRALEPIVEGFQDYFAALEKEEGANEARLALENALIEVLGEEDPLRENTSLGRAIWLAREPSRTKLRKGKVEEATAREAALPGGKLEYAYRVPRDYDPESRTYPLILALPGEDQEPDEHIRTQWSSREVRDGAIVVTPLLQAGEEDWDRPMVNGRPGPLATVLTTLRLAEASFAIDFSRVFVAGRGAHVPAAVATANFAPQRFAGVIGRAGDVGKLPSKNFFNLPTYFVGAGANAREFQDSAREDGHENCELNPTGKEIDVWNWLVKQRRDDHPIEARVVPGLLYPTRTYWLETSAMAPDAQATARIDHAMNAIHIESQGVSFVTLYLNDSLVDLSRPLKIVRNKVESTVTVERRVPVMLDLLRRGVSDPACLYVAHLVLDMRSEESSIGESPLASDREFQDRLKVAGQDPTRLWELYAWCVETSRDLAGRAALRSLLRQDPAHAEAHAALGHVAVGKLWFPSALAARHYRESQDEEIATSRGYVKHRETWLHEEERPLASKGLLKDPISGLWLSAKERRRLDKGWARSDFDWIEPDEVQHLDDGLWRVDGEWVSLEEANRRHSRIDRMWDIPGADFRIHTTTRREVAERARTHMSRALDDLRRAFGSEPALPLEVTLLAYEEQYDRFAFGSADGRRAGTHGGQLHILHSAFFAESLFTPVGRKFRFRGMGVGYWNADAPYGDAYGVHSARLAAGLSFIEALDPSSSAVKKATSKGPGESFYASYVGEKKLPKWFRYGGAVYGERFFRDDKVAEGGDVWWARKWSIDNLKSKGGLGELDEVFAFQLDEASTDEGLRLLIEAGLLVAFSLDGECEAVTAAHEQMTRAFASKNLKPEHIEAYEQALRDNEPKLRDFMQLEQAR